MASDDLFFEFINKLKKDKSDEEVGKFIAGLLKLGSFELLTTMLLLLTDEDIKTINDEPSDEKADEIIRERFTLRTGLSPEEFVAKLQDEIAKGYLFPELTPKQAPQAPAK